MKKFVETWSVQELRNQFTQIDFPEYQREPNVWGKNAKQRLIDSMLREFDIAPLYFYEKDNDFIDCVDGRQRIGAIMSFLGENQNDQDNEFEFKILNELYSDAKHPYKEIENKKYKEIQDISDKNKKNKAYEFVESIDNYLLTIVKLSDCKAYNEYNLQFARLNLGTIINSGEKLHAMVGDLRDECFNNLDKYTFLELTNIPERRYAKEQTIAQILAQVFSLEETKSNNAVSEFTKTRHYDLQRLFKENTILKNNSEKQVWINQLHRIMDLLKSEGKKLKVLRSRALVVSTVLLAYDCKLNSRNVCDFAEFINRFVCRLRWQVKKGLDVDSEYRYLIDFQRNITQGSVEKQAIKQRAMVLKEQFENWKKDMKISGDEEYIRKHHGRDPNVECEK